MFLKLLILSFFFIGISILILGFRIFFVKKGKFPEGSVSHNPELKKLGLECARHEEIKCRRELGEEISGCGCHLNLKQSSF